MITPDLFVGITTWNSETFISHCVSSVVKKTMGNNYQIHVIDNDSTDRTVELATAAGAEVYVQKCSQAEALNLIVARSNAKCTLLIHSDIMMLEENWFAECQIELDAEVILLSPQDIGCGPYTRPFGIGMPESFFLFFDTEKSRKARITRWNRRIRFPYRKRVVDYFGPHVTHNIPHWSQQKCMDWKAMGVLISPKTDTPIHIPTVDPDVWTEELAFLLYGLGYFYGLNGKITHCHNWYDRVNMNIEESPLSITGKNGTGFPVAYFKTYTENFLRDYANNRLQLPSPIPPNRTPVAL